MEDDFGSIKKKAFKSIDSNNHMGWNQAPPSHATAGALSRTSDVSREEASPGLLPLVVGGGVSPPTGEKVRLNSWVPA